MLCARGLVISSVEASAGSVSRGKAATHRPRKEEPPEASGFSARGVLPADVTHGYPSRDGAGDTRATRLRSLTRDKHIPLREAKETPGDGRTPVALSRDDSSGRVYHPAESPAGEQTPSRGS